MSCATIVAVSLWFRRRKRLHQINYQASLTSNMENTIEQYLKVPASVTRTITLYVQLGLPISVAKECS